MKSNPMHAKNLFQRLFRIFAVALLLVPVFCFQAAAERIQLDISSSGMRKLNVAVPPFADGSSSAGRKIAQLLSSALEFHGFVKVLAAQQQEADWRSMGADYVVIGKVSQQGGQMTVEGSLLDVTGGRTLPGKQFSGAASQQDDLTLRLADALVEEFTGEPGISRTSIAFVSDGTGRKEIYLADVLGRHVRQVTRHNHLCVSPRFSADGSRLAYSSYHRGNQNLYITDLSQNEMTTAISRRGGMNLASAFSPDGQTMIATLSKDGNPDLYLMDMHGEILERLTEDTGINVSASFSPDGRSIAFVSDRSGKPQIYVMNVRSRSPRLLTFQGEENVDPCWSPKGDKIAYTSLRGGRYRIFTVAAAGGEPTQITSGYGDSQSPSWSPDGKQIAFSRRRNGQAEICAVFADGKGERSLFRLRGSQSYPRWSPRRN